MPSLPIPAAFELALQHHQAGRLAEAEALYRQILAVQPGQADALHLLGVLAHQSGRPDIAVELIGQALHAMPQHAAAHFNLGNALRTLGRMEEAAAAYCRATEIQPGYTEAHHNLGSALAAYGQFGEASVAFRRALALQPDYASAHSNLGSALKALGQHDGAIAEFQRALALQPDCAETYFNLGNTLKECARLEEAVAAFLHALEIKPDYPDVLHNLGATLSEAGRLDEAIASYRHALRLNPDSAETQNNLGNALFELRRFDEAESAFRTAIALKPDLAKAHNNLANTLCDQGKPDEAIAELRRALALEPDSADFHNSLANLLKDQGDNEAALATYRRAMELGPDNLGSWTNYVYKLLFQPRTDDRALVEARAAWNQRFAEPVRRFIRLHANERDPERRLRIGYVSPNFRRHVVGANLLPLFRNHDHRAFEIYCYDGGVLVDSFHEEFRRGADRWRSTVGVSDEALAARIREDGVDILVDLAQHLAGNRLRVFARQPAPVQVSFAGYPETTGLEAIAYRISDRFLDTGSATHEQVLRIDSFWCYDPGGADIPVNELPAREKGCVTFGTLNNFSKVNEPTLKLWARVLHGVKGSRLLLLTHEGSHRRRTLDVLAQACIDALRIEFASPCSRPEYLALYHRLDIVLDPFPYNGHTTSLDALWMGVPVVSLAGETAVSRAGLSQLSNLGLPELVAFTEDDHVAKAIQLARDIPRLAELRRTLRERMEKSVLMDAPRFARGIENAYRKIWRQWCTGK